MERLNLLAMREAIAAASPATAALRFKVRDRTH
jgi:hypothetical protein